MIGEKRIVALLAMVLGIVAAALILSVSARGPSPDVVDLLAGLAVLYGSYLIFRGKTSLIFRRTKTRTGALINLVIGVLTLIRPGGVGGIGSVLAIGSGVLGLLAT
jgi:drug/metabolite transporter (DMT)-like permease